MRKKKNNVLNLKCVKQYFCKGDIEILKTIKFKNINNS